MAKNYLDYQLMQTYIKHNDERLQELLELSKDEDIKNLAWDITRKKKEVGQSLEALIKIEGIALRMKECIGQDSDKLLVFEGLLHTYDEVYERSLDHFNRNGYKFKLTSDDWEKEMSKPSGIFFSHIDSTLVSCMVLKMMDDPLTLIKTFIMIDSNGAKAVALYDVLIQKFDWDLDGAIKTIMGLIEQGILKKMSQNGLTYISLNQDF